MTPLMGLILILALVTVAGALLAIFVPVYQCPNCHSYDVHEVEPLGTEEECLTCRSCDHTWKSV
jgi:hypothetical protein